jgi:Tol biopolymer transport system component
MSQIDRLERDLTAWFVTTAVPRTPDYVDEILARATEARQRPAWSFPERWLPTTAIALAREALRPIPWRTIGLLAMLLLLLAAVALYAGSQPRPLPSPFGLAGNGLVAYAEAGDILTIDPITGSRSAMFGGPEVDSDPRWSLDGSRLAFVRIADGHRRLVVADASGRIIAQSDPLSFEPNSENILWSPDGRSIVLVSSDDGSIWIIDVETGSVRELHSVGVDGDLFWRPPDGHQLLFLGGTDTNRRLSLLSPSNGAVEDIPLAIGKSESLRQAGFTWDGQRVIYHRELAGQDRLSTFIADVDSGVEVGEIPAAYPRLSNDGTLVVGLRGNDSPELTWLCVARIDGGPCRRISEVYYDSWGTNYHWSPDDEWIYTTRSDGDGKWFVLDPDGVIQGQPVWAEDGAESWQRVAP